MIILRKSYDILTPELATILRQDLGLSWDEA